jgi:hypothetical protein
MQDPKHIFTLRQAQQLLPEVQGITRDAAARAAQLVERLEELPAGAARREVETEYQALLTDWAARITELGCEVKGLWLVDFDSGDGLYYCWQHPETALEYFHDYDAGFAGRRPLGPMLVS